MATRLPLSCSLRKVLTSTLETALESFDEPPSDLAQAFFAHHAVMS
jgi:hypothetical protein